MRSNGEGINANVLNRNGFQEIIRVCEDEGIETQSHLIERVVGSLSKSRGKGAF